MLHKIYEYPTKGEKEEGLDVEAKAILEKQNQLP